MTLHEREVGRSDPGPAPGSGDIGDAAKLVWQREGIVHILTCGSVDDGKSTLIGRLLWDATDLPEDTRASVLRSATGSEPPDLSLLVDGLAAEREQGITIDVAWRYFDAGSRRHVVIDSPGHEQYTRNMASGASHADVAVLLIDARHGVKLQTLRHAAILDLVGVRHVVLAINKMDLVDWSEIRFREIEQEMREHALRFRFEHVTAIPLAAKPGDNVVHRSAHMPWYRGPTLIERLADVPSRRRATGRPLRFPVQSVLRSGDFRGLAGTVSSGSLAVGTAVREVISGRQSTVKRIVTMSGDLERAASGDAVVIELEGDLDIARGAILVADDSDLEPVRRVEARLVWLSNDPLDKRRGMLFRTATDIVPVTEVHPRARLDLETLDEMPGSACTTNDIVFADISLLRPAALDRFDGHQETGSFVLVDALNGNTLAGGVIEALTTAPATRPTEAFHLTRELLGGVCAGVEPGSHEFRRRAEAVACILTAAGVTVDLGDPG